MVRKKRPEELYLAAYFLARCGKEQPPAQLNVDSWNEAYDLFWSKLNNGRTRTEFKNTLKNARDEFDFHLENERTGWDRPLGGVRLKVFNEWKSRPDIELFQSVLPWLNNEFEIEPVRSPNSAVSSGAPDNSQTRPIETTGVTAQSHQNRDLWSEDELILALDLYVRHGLIDEDHLEVRNLSDILRSRRDLSTVSDRTRFRNPNAIKLKLANLASADPAYSGKGMTRGSRLEKKVWDSFGGNPDLLHEVAGALRVTNPIQDRTGSPGSSGIRQIVEVERIHTPEFEVFTPGGVRIAKRREQKLVKDLEDHLHGRGHKTSAHNYQIESHVLRCDLFDDTANVLYEAKGTSHRFQVRMAIGQLMDYQRFEPSDPHLAILLPYEPNPHIFDLCGDLKIGIAWKIVDGFDAVGVPGVE